MSREKWENWNYDGATYVSSIGNRKSYDYAWNLMQRCQVYLATGCWKLHRSHLLIEFLLHTLWFKFMVNGKCMIFPPFDVKNSSYFVLCRFLFAWILWNYYCEAPWKKIRTVRVLIFFYVFCFFLPEAKAEILGAPDLYIMSGSSLRLVCRLQESTQAPLFVFWYHSDRMINFDTDRGLVVHINSTESDLIMPYTNTSDSGNYTCHPQNIDPATIHVHVLQCKYAVENLKKKNRI